VPVVEGAPQVHGTGQPVSLNNGQIVPGEGAPEAAPRDHRMTGYNASIAAGVPSHEAAAKWNLPGRGQVVSFWQTQGGVPPHVAEGIADAVGVESSFNPDAPGDYKNGAPTSGGYYQHHADRLEELQAFAAQQGRAWRDGNVQN